MTGEAVDPAVAFPSTTDQPLADAGEPVPGAEQQVPPRHRRRAFLLLLLSLLVGVLLLFTIWYVINRKPISELPLPGVTTEVLPHYSFSLYSVAAPTGVAVNADGSRIYATQTEGDARVLVFDGSGKTIAALAPPVTGGDHVLVYVAINPTNGDVYVSDRPAGAIYVYSADGVYRRTFDPGPALKGWAPLGLAFDAKGDLFVTSLGAPYQAVHEFGPGGLFVRTFGKLGEFNFPNGVAIDANGNVYISDSNNGRLVVFDPNGTRIGVVSQGSARGDLGLPRGVAIDDSGRVYVADISSQGIQIYHAIVSGDQQPKFAGHIGTEGSGDGAFLFPNAVAVDGRSRLYVADWRNNRIQVWSY